MTDLSTVVVAVKELDASLWELGDALIEACGPRPLDGSTGSHHRMQELVRELQELGLADDYPLHRLRTIRNVADDFPPHTRVPGVSWDVHRRAGSPQLLQEMLSCEKSRP